MSRLDELYARYFKPLIADLVQFGQRAEDAPDIAQETMIAMWKRLDQVAEERERLGGPPLNERIEKPRKPFALRLYAAAVTLAIPLLFVFQRPQPVVHTSHHELNALLRRGARTGASYQFPAGQQRYLITVIPSEPLTEQPYELRIARGTDVLWHTGGVRPVDDTFIIEIPGRFLKPGAYALDLSAEGRLIERYPFYVIDAR